MNSFQLRTLKCGQKTGCPSSNGLLFERAPMWCQTLCIALLFCHDLDSSFIDVDWCVRIQVNSRIPKSLGGWKILLIFWESKLNGALSIFYFFSHHESKIRHTKKIENHSRRKSKEYIREIFLENISIWENIYSVDLRNQRWNWLLVTCLYELQ